MANAISGLDGYIFYRRNLDDGTDTRLNTTPVPEHGPYTVTGLDASTDYAGQFLVAPVDKAGNEGPKVPILGTQTVDPTPEQSLMVQVDRDAIDAIMAQALARAKGSGFSIAVVSPKGYYTQSYGTGTHADAHYRIASQTKTWTAHAVLQAIDDGRLDFDDRLEQFVPGVANGNDITVRHLLNMTSGVHDYQVDGTLGFNFYLNPAMALSVDQIIERIRVGAPMFLPGQGYHYTNSNFFLLGKILESVDLTGRRCDQIVAQDVLAPAGMVNSSFPITTKGLPAPHAAGWHNNVILEFLGLPYPQDVTVQNPAMVWASGAGVSVLSDMVQWGRTMRDGTLLSPAMHADLLAFAPEDYHPTPPWGLNKTGPTTYGYRYGLYQVGSWYGHGGSWIGYDSGTMFEPRTGTIISVYANYQDPGAAAMTLAWFEIAEYLYPNSARFPGYMSGADTTGAPATALAGLSTSSTGIVYEPGVFPPVDEENLTVTDAPVPVGAAGCWVSSNGGGAAGLTGTNDHRNLGRGGGGSGARIDRVWVPVEAMGPTYSTRQGLGGAVAGAHGGDSFFRSGAVDLTAGGGRAATDHVGGAGGTAIVAGLAGVTSHPGMQGGTGTGGVGGAGGSDPTNEVAGGGGAGSTGLGTPLGGAGGNSPGATGGTGGIGGHEDHGQPGLPGGDATAGHVAGGGGGGGGKGYITFGSGRGGAGGKGGRYGGGGGSGGNGNNNGGIGGAFGPGADGHLLVEWR